uniref:Putative abc transporter g family member 20 n=1 Tax=Nyssomyia neivai TaxID=330878 RepID=A0A1L8DDG1_9DIPT
MDAEEDGIPPPGGSRQDDQDWAVRRRQFMSQPSTVASRRLQAVCVRRACKNYGPKKNPNVILDSLNMTVPKGVIYGLLGASGCGKTTLLSCIVGRRRLNSGELWVVGGHPGSRGSGVPGPRVAYMPQELALYGEFTLQETFTFFGRINGMPQKSIEERMDFLIKLLQLPHHSSFVKNLSGGQQRRTSLAATLLHDPELLILDEPTVGVDPVVRQNIWDHLVEITRPGQKTVIITTHYIEETRQAHLIGLMRGGKLLAEESPENLLLQYNCQTLEDVFLKLAVMQNMGKRRRSSIAQEVIQQIPVPSITNPALDISDEDKCEISGEFGDNISMSSRGRDVVTPDPINMRIPEPELPPHTFLDNFKIFKMHHMRTLIWKNFLWMWRNVGIMAFIIGLPLLQIVLFCFAIGKDPKNLKLAISNNELTDPLDCPVTMGCNDSYLSCRYLKFLEDRHLQINLYSSDGEAEESVRRGKAWGAVSFPQNYSIALVERMELGRYAEESTLDTSMMSVTMDMSNDQIGFLIYRDLQYAYLDFIQDVLKACDMNPALGLVPVHFQDPIYGPRNPDFTDFAAPGVILTIIFFLSVDLKSGAMLIERNEGMLERYLVSGITGVEILFSHVATQFMIMVGQTILVLLFAFTFFGLTINGEMALVIILTILTGLCGMTFGFVVSCACDTERTATYLALGSFLPIVMLCGIIWPIEGMSPELKIAAYFLPLTNPTESLRFILQKGWSIGMFSVSLGFITVLAWIVIFLTLSILLLKFKKG